MNTEKQIHIQPANRIKEVEEYYFSKKLAEVRGLDSPEWRVINLGIGSPDQMPSKNAIDALTESANNAANHGYQNYKGIPQLRKAIADFYHRIYAVTINSETEILPLIGSKEGIMHIMMAFVNEGDEVLIPNPGYPTYASVVKLVGAKARTYSLRENSNWGIDLDELRKSDLSKVKVMWVNFPHMPTGRIASKKEMQELVDLARENNFLIVNDNPYSLILNQQPLSILSCKGANEVALELNSLSKSHNMAGWRIGWVAGNAQYVDAVVRVKSNMDSGMFLGLQHAAVEALQNDASWFQQLNEVYAKRKKVASQILDVLGCKYSDEQSGLFVWAKAPDAIANVEKWIDEILYGTRVFITPGFIFGDAGERYMRISLCATEEKLNEALERIEIFLLQHKIVHPKSKMRLTVIGLGLIGGSMAIDLRKKGLTTSVVGVDANPTNGKLAVELGLVDKVSSLEEAVKNADVLVVSIPVNSIHSFLPGLLDIIELKTIVIDTGSTKNAICKSVATHHKRNQLVAAHQIAGTENSGPSAAFAGLFAGKTNIICEKQKSSETALLKAQEIFDALGLNTIFMEPEEHDKHVAYVSHLSHVSSFLLGQTVLDIEKDEKNIFNLAGSGFASTVRLAKSSPEMWAPIFEQNSEFLSQALSEYIMHLQRFHYHLMKHNTKELLSTMKKANEIRRILK